jgi:hypothetical protein
MYRLPARYNPHLTLEEEHFTFYLQRAPAAAKTTLNHLAVSY